MDNFTFGVTVTVVGMGGTLVTLWVLSLMMNLLKKFFPLAAEESRSVEKRGKEGR